MNIITLDGRSMQGTAKQIIQQMAARAHQTFPTLTAYMEWSAGRALAFEGVELCLTGESEEEKAESMVAQLLEKGLVTKGN